jgi:alginate O-acetyltransferase complex protein AlgJ
MGASIRPSVRDEPSIGKAQVSREEEADRALRHTVFAPGAAPLLCLAFLLTIVSVPALQHLVEIRRGLTARAEAGSAPSLRSLVPQCYDIFSFLPSLADLGSVRSPRQAWDLLPRARDLREYETALENGSVLSEWALPPTQLLLARLLGAGNEQAYLGREGWLVYRPEIDYLTHPGFLDPASLRQRERGGAEDGPVQPDPVKAILHFQRQLAARGISLILMPVPVKPMIHPEKLSPRYTPQDGPLQNPSYPRFRTALEQAGVLLFDVSQALADAKQQTGEAQYLATDTHWTPGAMERSAAALAELIRARALLPARPPVVYRRETAEVANLGDIATMLKLPPGQGLFARQRVSLHPVRTRMGEPWRPEPDADILLLGDSFSNIYSLPGMGWGEGAGFAEQLSWALSRPIDALTLNAGGSYATRHRLRQELGRGEDRLAGKRLVIWQFAMRDLLVGDWKIIDLPGPGTTHGSRERAAP